MNTALLLAGGTDPSGGAGLAADLRTAAAMGFYGLPVVSALTVQTAGNVISWQAVDPSFLRRQLDAVFADGPVAAVKTGMLGSSENARVVSEFIRSNAPDVPCVLDPVISAGGGGSLSDRGLPETIMADLLPLCTLFTPNLDEAEILTGLKVRTVEEMTEAGGYLLRSGAGAVLVKGGHMSGDPADVLVTRNGSTVYRDSRIQGGNVHGTGCTLASACASLLAWGCTLESSVEEARRFVRRAIRRKVERGTGFLPGHFPPAGPPPVRPDGVSFYLEPACCSMCGEPLKKPPGAEGHLHCGSCGFLHYRNPLPAVTLIVRNGERILLVRRAVPPKKGMLCLPGGFLEMGETPFECGRRELLEETGLTARESKLLGLETDTTAYGGILLAVLEVTSWEGAPSAGDDASEIVWMKPDEVPELAFAAHGRLVRKLAERSAAE